MLNISCINRNFLILNSLGIKYLFVCVLSGAVKSDSLQPHGLQPARHLCPGNFPGKNIGVGCHFLSNGSSWFRPICLASPALTGKLYHWITWKPLYTHKKPIWNITNITELPFRKIFQIKKQHKSINCINEIIQWPNIEWINQ